jgi:glucokinase
MSAIIIGIDLGGTKTAAAVADVTGRLLASDHWPSQAERGPSGMMELAFAHVRALLAQVGARPGDVAAVGCGCGGPLDRSAGLIMSPPNLPDWDRIPLRAWLEAEFGAPAAIDNDVNAAALGEYHWGAGRGLRDLLYVNLGTGVGGGVIVDGKLLHGVRDSAGEIGHTTVWPDGPRCGCGNRGCLEALASGPSIARRARQALAAGRESRVLALAGGRPEAVTARLLAEAASQGDPLARELWDQIGQDLGIALGNAIGILSPQLIVLGGGVARAGELLFEPARRTIRQRVFVVPVDQIPIVPTALGDDTGLYGAVALALEVTG